MTYQRTIGPENAHLKPGPGAFSHHERALTLSTQRTFIDFISCLHLSQVSGLRLKYFPNPIVFTFSSVKAKVSKINLASKKVKVILGSSFEQIKMG